MYRREQIKDLHQSMLKTRDEHPEMAFIPGGTFLMGMLGVAEPVHQVWISPFLMDKVPMTNSAMTQFGIKGPPTHPAVNISHEEATKYAAKLGKHLPTEAQWERAARGLLVQAKYPLGNSITKKDACFDSTRTVPVAWFTSNYYGLFDMTGNVWELCRDRYYAGIYNQHEGVPDPKAEPDMRDVVHKNFEHLVVRRGGAWNTDMEKLACGYRGTIMSKQRAPDTGFRCVINFEEYGRAAYSILKYFNAHTMEHAIEDHRILFHQPPDEAKSIESIMGHIDFID
jgi:formylglycine-generating enzyme required for sulfatase activity